MALSDSLTLENAFNTNNTFSRTKSSPDGEWVDTASTPAEPRGLKVKHQVSGKGSNAVDRHLIQVYKTKVSTTDGQPKTAVVNITMNLPRDAILSSTDVYNLFMNAVELIAASQFGPLITALTLTNFDKILRGEQ